MTQWRVHVCVEINITVEYQMCTVADVQSDEVCQMEMFHAQCPSDSVIVIESAQLGRLKIGICIACNFILATIMFRPL